MVAHDHRCGHHTCQDIFASLAVQGSSAFNPLGIFQGELLSTFASSTGGYLASGAGLTETSSPTPVVWPTRPAATTSALIVYTPSSEKRTPCSAKYITVKTLSELASSIAPTSSSLAATAGFAAVTISIPSKLSSILAFTDTALAGPSSVATSGSGISIGGRADLVIGILCFAGIVASIVFFCCKKCKNESCKRLYDDR